MDTPTVKEQAHKLIDALPAGATWDDLMHEIYVRQAIEAGLTDRDAGRLTAVQEVRAQFGLPQWPLDGHRTPYSSCGQSTITLPKRLRTMPVASQIALPGAPSKSRCFRSRAAPCRSTKRRKFGKNIRGAALCHFDSGKAPRVLRGHIVQEEVLAAWGSPAAFPASVWRKRSAHLAMKLPGKQEAIFAWRLRKANTTIPRHESLRVGTLAQILTDVGVHFSLSRDELLVVLSLWSVTFDAPSVAAGLKEKYVGASKVAVVVVMTMALQPTLTSTFTFRWTRK